MAKMARRSTSKTTERRTERMELRVPPSAKELIRRAMAISGRSAADLAYDAARRVIDEHERMLLTDRNREVFLAAVRDPPRPTARLIAALQRHDQIDSSSRRRSGK